MLEALWQMDLQSLKALYTKESKTLAEALLQGKDWNELQEKRKLITQISIVIDRKTEGFTDPATHNNR